jgi:hypothetical protein
MHPKMKDITGDQRKLLCDLYPSLNTFWVIQSKNSHEACYHSVQNLLSSHLLPKNIEIKEYRTTTSPVILCWCETWFPCIKGRTKVEGVGEQGPEEGRYLCLSGRR